MSTLRSLKCIAGKSARFRGHVLSRWETLSPEEAEAVCRRCYAQAYINTKPPANGIDIGGRAVAVDCPYGETEQ